MPNAFGQIIEIDTHLPDMFLSFNFQCRRMSSQVDTTANTTNLATDRANAELE